jgi:choline dehydrogenase-like flavoprotein
MHTDARQIDDNSLIEGDICIIGSGAAGISIALEWINTPYKIILLEGGGFEYEDRVQELYRGQTSGQNYYPLKAAHLHYFGGTTGHWGGLCSTFDPIAFQKRDWIDHSGWPFTDKELLEYYKRAHSVLELGTYEFDLSYWQKQNPSLVSMAFDSKVFWTKIWRYGIPASMKFGATFRDKIVNAGNVHLYTYANVTDISANENVSAINELTVKNYSGKTHKVKARYFVLACGGIENARLLLASNKQSGQGLGNDNDLVGRYFMENVEIRSAELWLEKRSSLELYMHAPPNIRAELAITAAKLVELKILNGMLSFTPLEKARKIPPFIKSWTNEDPREDRKNQSEIYEKSERTKVSRFFKPSGYDSFEVTLRLEQAPNPLSRVMLSSEKDELGMPRAHLHWQLTELERKSARKIYEMLGEQAGISGIGRVRLLDNLEDEKDMSMPSSTSGGWHHMGTTRMNDDYKKGVVDSNCKIHTLDNLYVAGSSCYPNGAAVNPTFTLIALSLRLSDHLKKKITENRFI